METKIQKALTVIVWKAEPGARDKRILVLKLTEKRGAFWQPVTGGVEEGETFAQAALREAEEETGLKFERQPQYLGLEYEFEGQHGPAVERAFFLPVYGGEKPPTPRLDPREHTEYRWVLPREAAALVKYPANRQAIERSGQDLPPLFLTRRGVFLQEGEEISHERTAELLHSSLHRTPSGLFHVSIDDDELDVVVEDTPRFVRAYDRDSGKLKLSDGMEEALDPKTLRVRPDNTLVCQLRSGWGALFLSPAYYEIAKDIREESGKYLLHFRGRDYDLSVAR
jgi:8-oxo-dGTP pyrophosphatase MutT (NUDIX family)